MEFSLEQISGVAAQVIEKARQAKLAAPDVATVITLSGGLGAGKTTLTKEIAKQLGVTDDLQSPTYVIYKKYETGQGNPWNFLVHGDMYRLESADEIQKLGWNELVSNPEHIIIVEWPEMITGAIPKSALRVVLTHKGELLRNIDFS